MPGKDYDECGNNKDTTFPNSMAHIHWDGANTGDQRFSTSYKKIARSRRQVAVNTVYHCMHKIVAIIWTIFLVHKRSTNIPPPSNATAGDVLVRGWGGHSGIKSDRRGENVGIIRDNRVRGGSTSLQEFLYFLFILIHTYGQIQVREFYD